MIIGVTGTDGAGKSTVVAYLVKKKGFVHKHVRTMLLAEAHKRGLPTDREHMRLIANILRKEHGNDFIVRCFLKETKDEGLERVIIDSVRTVAEARLLKVHGGMLLAVDANSELRYKRIRERNSESDQVSFEEFKAQEALESNDPDPHGMQKSEVIKMADYIIMNNGTAEELCRNIDSLLKKEFVA